MDPLVTGAIIAVTEAIKRALPGKIEGLVTIVVAAVLGILYAVYQSGDVVQGALNGLLAAGIITTAKAISSK